MNYKVFPNFVFRTPAFSIGKWKSYIANLQDGNFDVLLSDNYFLEAIFIASPVLYNEISKYKSGKLSKKEEERFISSLLRYFFRMSWRCTPFGLFSGCSVGNISNETKIVLPEEHNYKRYTRLDMNYLCALIKNISQREEIKSKLKYYPNNSLYPIGNQFRYVEYVFQGTVRKHNIISIDKSEYLQSVLQSSESGQTIDFLAQLLVKEDITFDEGKEFVLELIDNQVLVSEIEPTVTGKDVLDTLIKKLFVINKDLSIVNQLIKIQKQLQEVNKLQIGITIPLYNKIISNIENIDVSFDPKFLFQTDLIKNPIKASISDKTINEVYEAIVFLNKLMPIYINSDLNNFKTAFSNRFEDKEMPLLIVLDNEMGIGYPIGKEGDVVPLFENFVFPNNVGVPKQQIDWDNIQAVLNNKYIDAQKNRKYEINLLETDFNLQPENWTDTPDTFMAMCRFLSFKNDKAQIYLSSCGGSSAANLLARFAHTDEAIENHIIQITEKESELQKDAIIAEIVHLPESRIGNIIFRPTIRNYEIPYLAKSSVENEFQIPLSDLYISIKDSQISLRSMKLNKQIIPKLTNAHNYSMNAMPVYNFLCDLQTENQRTFFKINWSNMTKDYPFLPRLKYKNVILSLARWLIKIEDLKFCISDGNIEKITMWRLKQVMPQYLFMPDGDNEFFVDMENLLSIKSLFDIVKQRKQIYLYEFPFDYENALALDCGSNIYTNEFIFGFYKET